ncbi:MAG TPA: hypothetical protein VIO61_07055 [Anaerolineaceae bacterium]
MGSTRTILHLDLDALFCAVEELRDPELNGNFGNTLYHTSPASPPQANMIWRVTYSVGRQRMAVRVKTATTDILT